MTYSIYPCSRSFYNFIATVALYVTKVPLTGTGSELKLDIECLVPTYVGERGLHKKSPKRYMSSTHTPPQSKRQLLFISRRNRELEQEAERARKLSFIEVDSKLVNEIQRILEIEKKVATRLLKEANGSAEKCLETFLDEEK